MSTLMLRGSNSVYFAVFIFKSIPTICFLVVRCAGVLGKSIVTLQSDSLNPRTQNVV
jgi:hypothetical protein